MNWDALGAIAETIGAIAVLATLIYLALQVRHSKSLLERNEKIALSQVYSARANARMEDLRLEATNPHILKMRAESRGVDEERMLRRLLASKNIVHYDNFLYQHELGLVSDSDLRRITMLILNGYPYWKSLGMDVEFERVENWYHDHKDDA